MKILNTDNAVLGATNQAITGVTRGTTTVLSVASTSGMYKNGSLRISTASGGSANWNNMLSKVYHILAISTDVSVTIALDTSGWDDSYPTTFTCRGSFVLPLNVIRTISGITAANPAVITTTAYHYLKPGDIVSFADIVGVGAISDLNAATSLKQFIVRQVLSQTTFSIYQSTSGGTYTSGGTITTPYGTTLPFVAADSATTISPHTPITAEQSVSELLARIYLRLSSIVGYGNTSTKLTLYAFAAKSSSSIVDFSPQNIGLLGQVDLPIYPRNLQSIFGKLDLTAFVYDASYADGVMLFIKPETVDGTAEYAFGYSGSIIAQIIAKQITDSYGRVDVGLVNGATPISKSDIISSSGDGSAIITRNGRVLGTGSGTPMGGR